MSKVIMTVAQKGGVGKSTTAYYTTLKLKGLLLNIDQTQSAEDINAGGFSIDLLDENIDLVAALNDAKEQVGYTIIDTPSNFKPGQTDYNRIISLINEIDLFVIPLKKGSRAVNATLDTLRLLFGNDTQRIKPVKILFILNDIKSTGLKSKVLEQCKEYVHDNVISELVNIDFGVEIDEVFIDYFMWSKAIETLEDEDMTLDELFETNKGAYKNIQLKANEITNDIKEILGN
jgi:cellulose biosynthesis protein BcsQ